MRFLVHDQPRDDSEGKTIGINRLSWKPGGDGPSVNVSDFGGQEIQYQTRRFFLTERSLYLVVLEARREDDDSVFDWLKIIEGRSADSPVIVVINKCEKDEDRYLVNIDEVKLRADHPQIVDIVHTSCDDTDYAPQRIAALTESIRTELTSPGTMLPVRDNVPESWLAVKQLLVERADSASVLSMAEYEGICTNNGLEPILDADVQRSLLSLLNILGVVVVHGLEDPTQRPAA